MTDMKIHVSGAVPVEVRDQLRAARPISKPFADFLGELIQFSLASRHEFMPLATTDLFCIMCPAPREHSVHLTAPEAIARQEADRAAGFHEAQATG